MSEATVAGVPALRACITSYRTTEADVRWIVHELNKLLPGSPIPSGQVYDELLQPNHAAQESLVSL